MAVSRILVLVFVSFGGSAVAADGGAVYLKLPEAQRERFLSAWQGQLRSVAREIETTQKSIRSLPTVAAKKAAAAKVEELKKKKAEIERNDPPFVPVLHPDDYQVGAVGRCDFAVRVVQVIDEKTMLAEFGREARGGHGVQMVRGFSTKGFADNDRVELSDPIHFSGTTKYATAAGTTRTVYVIEPWIPPWAMKADE